MKIMRNTNQERHYSIGQLIRQISVNDTIFIVEIHCISSEQLKIMCLYLQK